jgi:four helix bundle protein
MSQAAMSYAGIESNALKNLRWRDSMAFGHKQLVVYQKAILVVAAVAVLARQVAKVDPWLAGQLRRAAASIALNIAEGAGEYSRADKARFYRMARRSAFELSAALDIVERYVGIPRRELDPTDSLLDEIAAMLTTMTKKLGTTAEPIPRPRPRLRPRPKSE